METRAVLGLKETRKGPGEGVDKVKLEDLLVNGLLVVGVREKHSLEQREELSHTDDHWAAHHVQVALLEGKNKLRLLDVLGSELVHPLGLVRVHLRFGRCAVQAPSVQQGLPTKVGR